MNLKAILDEALQKSEKVKEEVLKEVLKSKTIKEITANRNFVNAIARIIETKDDVKKVINKQVHNVFSVMDVPSQKDIKKIANKLSNLEDLIDILGSKTVRVSSLKKSKSKKTASSKKKTGKKTPTRRTKKTSAVTKKKATKKKSVKKKSAPKAKKRSVKKKKATRRGR
ncbi:MAG: hypothetical protein H7A33_01580 [Deltaproteobacteria bacterium]|nr:hypothetical protein [Deltaproteobacteria bacterium]